MSIESELLQLAREREAKSEGALAEMLVESPDLLRRQLRDYLFRQVDSGRMKRPDEKILRLNSVQEGFRDLACPKAEFSSGTHLQFNIRFEDTQGGCLVKRFQFIYLSPARRIKVVRIELNAEPSRDPLSVPRCHLHIGNSEAHIPFPIMDPRLILYLFCEHLERDFGS